MFDSVRHQVEDVSIVTAVYNHQDTVAKTLDSILMQETSRSFHVYCLDDASTDKSGEILAEYRSRHPDRITVFTSAENQGSGKRSFLHHRPPVNGRYWCLLAGDDYWLRKDKLERQVNLLEENTRAVGCSTHTLVLDEQTGEESIIKPEKQRYNLVDYLLRRYPLYVHPSGLLWRNVHLKSGFFLPPAFINNDISGDTILLHLMLAGGGEIINLPEVASCYRMTGRGVWTRLSQEEKYAANQEISEAIRTLVPLKYRAARKANASRRYRVFSYFLPKPVNG